MICERRSVSGFSSTGFMWTLGGHAGGPRLQRLRAADLAAFDGGRVVRHVLRLERPHRAGRAGEEPAQAGDEQRLADIRAGALDHDGRAARHASAIDRAGRGLTATGSRRRRTRPRRSSRDALVEPSLRVPEGAPSGVAGTMPWPTSFETRTRGPPRRRWRRRASASPPPRRRPRAAVRQPERQAIHEHHRSAAVSASMAAAGTSAPPPSASGSPALRRCRTIFAAISSSTPAAVATKTPLPRRPATACA